MERKNFLILYKYKFNKLKERYKVMNDITSFILLIVILYFTYYIFKKIYNILKEKEIEKKLISSNIKDIDKLDGLQFEEYLKALFKELGYKVIVTKGSNDFGEDLVMKKSNNKIVLQAKRYKSNVGIDAVQQIYTAKPYYKADKTWILTNSFYTKSAKELAKVCNVKLFNRYDLIRFISNINPSVTPQKIKKTIKPKERKCPNCNNLLIVRKNKKGNEFFGCSNFPKCKHTEKIAN